MSYTIGGKFVSKEKYEAHHQAKQQADAIAELAQGEAPVTDEAVTPEEAPRKSKVRNPLSAATTELNKAKAEVKRVEALWAKYDELPPLDEVKKAYEAAKAKLHAVLQDH